MSKRAEEAALKAYPPTYTTVKRYAKRVQSELVDTHKPVRVIFQQGYEQAEKETIQWLRDKIERRLEELNPKQGEFAGMPLRSVNPRTFPRESELEKLISLLDELEKE